MTGHRPELAALVGPFVPDRNPMLLEISDVRLAAQEPEQLVDDRFQMHPLRGEQRKTLREIEPQLMAEDRERTDPGAIVLFHALGENSLDHCLVLSHRKRPPQPVLASIHPIEIRIFRRYSLNAKQAP